MPAVRVNAVSGLIRRWQVSEELDEAEAVRRASLDDWAGVRWTPLAVETNGVANLGRVIAKKSGTHFAISRFEVTAEQAATKRLKVGYSDIARIYVNGTLVFEGDNRQYSHDPGFLGIVGLNDTLALPLRRGRNDITFVIEETSGGWAAQAQFVDRAGLQSAAFDAPS